MVINKERVNTCEEEVEMFLDIGGMMRKESG
jgi:hypothetical protein